MKQKLSKLFNQNVYKTFLGIIVFSITIVTIFIACNKQAQQSSVTSQAIENNNAALARITTEIQKNGMKYTIPLNIRMDSYYGDSLGNRITPINLKKNGGVTENGISAPNSITSACDGNPNWYASINTFTLITDCIHGYEITFNTIVSSDNNIVAVSPYNSSRKTYGTIRVYNPSSTLVYSNLAIPIDASTNPPIDLGPDATTPGNEFFSVTFTSGWISSTVFDPTTMASYTMKLGAFYESNCSDLESQNGGLWANTFTSVQFPGADPINRVDAIWIGALTTNPYYSFYGENPTGSCTMNFTMPHLQEIDVSLDGGSNWTSTYSSYTNNANPGFTFYYSTPGTLYGTVAAATTQNLKPNCHYGYVDPNGVLQFEITTTSLDLPTHPAHGTMLLRSRNIMYNTAPPAGGVWPVPTVGINCTAGQWSLNSSYSF